MSISVKNAGGGGSKGIGNANEARCYTVEPVEENSFVAVESKYSESIGVFSTTGQSCNTAVPVCNGEFVLTQSSDTFALIRSTAYEEYIVENTITVPFDSVTSKNVFCGKMVKLDEYTVGVICRYTDTTPVFFVTLLKINRDHTISATLSSNTVQVSTNLAGSLSDTTGTEIDNAHMVIFYIFGNNLYAIPVDVSDESPKLGNSTKCYKDSMESYYYPCCVCVDEKYVVVATQANRSGMRVQFMSGVYDKNSNTISMGGTGLTAINEWLISNFGTTHLPAGMVYDAGKRQLHLLLYNTVSGSYGVRVASFSIDTDGNINSISYGYQMPVYSNGSRTSCTIATIIPGRLHAVYYRYDSTQIYIRLFENMDFNYDATTRSYGVGLLRKSSSYSSFSGLLIYAFGRLLISLTLNMSKDMFYLKPPAAGLLDCGVVYKGSGGYDTVPIAVPK